MSDANPVVALSAEEKKSTIDVSKVGIRKRMWYNKKVEQVMQEFKNKGKPFCHHCAITAYENYKKQIASQVQSQVSAGQPIEEAPTFNPDFAEFSNTMQKIGKSSKTDRTTLGNFTKASVEIFYEDYKCKKCGGMTSIELGPQGAPVEIKEDKKK